MAALHNNSGTSTTTGHGVDAGAAPPTETRRPGVVRLLETEPTQSERSSHAARLLWLIDHPVAVTPGPPPAN